MDILNIISWIKRGNYRTTLPKGVTSLIPIGAQDASRDDGYLPLAVNAAPLQTLYYSDNVVQGTSITTAVTVDALNGKISTVSSTLAANAKATFTVNNSFVQSNSKIIVSFQYDDAATGIPVVYISDVATGSFKIVIANSAGTQALNDKLVIHFLIVA